jgi:V/A-type H+-transporting ATPase subunit C
MYEYASGLIRVLEKKLPDKTDIERMVLARNAKQAFDVLNDTDYADNLLNRGPADYNQILEDDFKQLKKLLLKIIGKTMLFDFLFIDFDFLNIKIILKQKLLDAKDDLVSLSDQVIVSTVPPETIKKFIDLKYKLIQQKAKKKIEEIDLKIIKTESEIKKIKIDQNLKKSLINIINKLSKGKTVTPSIIGTVCDQEMMGLKRGLAKKIKNHFIKDLIKLQIDFLNTKILLRSIREKKNKNFKFRKKHFIQGGRVKKKQLVHLYKADQPVLYTNLMELLEWYGISCAMDEFKKHQNLWQMEKELDARIFDFTRTAAKNASYGPEIIVAYFLAKMIGVRNIRTIMSGKLNGIGVEDIKARVIV